MSASLGSSLSFSEHAAVDRPLIVVFDDIQWGEQTFLELVEHVALLSSTAPILLLCIARPQLVERRAAWPVSLRLEPLGDQAVDQLIPEGIPAELRKKIARAAGGNPLFIEEMLATASEAEGEVVVPPTLRALLAARLDQLETGERSVLELGAVEGEIFHRSAIETLAGDKTHVMARLAALVRKELIKPERSQYEGDDGFRFHHLLIRDAAYDALPKATRAELHKRFAIWLEEHGAALVELDEILGHHLEQACRYLAELETSDGLTAAAAQRRLGAAGLRAYLRADYGAAVSLLERSLALAAPDEIDLVVELDVADALYWGGRIDDAVRRATSLTQRATTFGDQVTELSARVHEHVLRTYLEPEGAIERLEELVGQALPLFEAPGADLALSVAYRAVGQVATMRGQMDGQRDALELAAAHARKAGVPHEFLEWRAAARVYGTTPALELLAWLNEHGPRAASNINLRRCRP